LKSLNKYLPGEKTSANINFEMVSQSARKLSAESTVVVSHVPEATCFTQAPTIQLVLKHSGREASLHIGVNGVEDHLGAHAWVESQGRVLFGGSNLGSYTHLLALE
jgi:hypothetical protein